MQRAVAARDGIGGGAEGRAMDRRWMAINLVVFLGLVVLLEAGSSLWYAARWGESPALMRLTDSVSRRLGLGNDCFVTHQLAITADGPLLEGSPYGRFHHARAAYAYTLSLARPVRLPTARIEPVQTYRWSFRTGAYGNRLTSPGQAEATDPDGRPIVLVLGDSYLQGEGVDDVGSHPWLLQSLRPDREVFNMAHGGRGAAHMLAMLRTAGTDDGLIPAAWLSGLDGGAVVLGYADFYGERNVVSAARSQELASWARCFEVQGPDGRPIVADTDRLHATVSPDGSVQLARVPVEGMEVSPEQVDAVSVAIYAELVSRVRALGATPVVAWVEGPDDDDTIASLRDAEVAIVDLRPEAGVWSMDDLQPFDDHPGPLSQHLWAQRLAAAIPRDGADQ